MLAFVNPFEIKGNWYKANFHTHTTASDGGLPVETVVANYRRKGYDVLVVSDHNATHDVRPLTSKKMLVISGIELHPPMKTFDGLFHIVGVNVPHGFDPHSKAADQANSLIRRVDKAGGLTILAHPYWCGLAYEDFKHLIDQGIVLAFEIEHHTCDKDFDAFAKSVFEHMKQCKAHLEPAAFMEWIQLLIFHKRSWDDPEFHASLLEGRQAAAEDPFPQPLHGVHGQAAACINHNTLDQLQNITAPTLVIGGEGDAFTPRWMAEEIHAELPNSKLHLYPESGHAFHWENLDDFNPRIIDFIKANA